MKKRFWIILLLVAFAHGVPLVPSCNNTFVREAESAPFVLSDPYQPTEAQPEYFLLFFDNSPVGFQINVSRDDQQLIILYYDIGLFNLPAGSHTVAARAGKGTEVSSMTEAIPFTLSIPPPAIVPPRGIRVVQ